MRVVPNRPELPDDYYDSDANQAPHDFFELLTTQRNGYWTETPINQSIRGSDDSCYAPPNDGCLGCDPSYPCSYDRY